MPNERENLYQPLTSVDYDIAGNVFRAYYDASKKLVMVLDFVVSDVKPNVLLVINPVGDRKWDDILMNDYAVDLETIRPKKDNRYQKLDIEYTGLAEYDDLVRVYNAGGDVAPYAAKLMQFREIAARRAALERLGAADIMATRARDTIEKTNETIDAQQVRLKVLRAKLAEQRRGVGKEPTKESAAKILKTESQIDATNDKLGRARKRLASAQHRLNAADEEAEIAREILARLDETVDDAYVDESDDVAEINLPAAPMPTDVAEFEQPSVPMTQVPQFTEITTYAEPKAEPEFKEPKAEDMADDEVKPLFDKDPEILDEEIAFKPIDFTLPSEVAQPTVSEAAETTQPPVEAPVSFVPPVSMTPVPEPEVPLTSPVLDTLTPVELPSERLNAGQIDSELLPSVGASYEPVAPTPEPVMPQPVMPVEQVVAQSAPTPMPEISPAPIDAGMRPVSPITGDAGQTVAVVRRRPTALYYVLLIALIALSVFTLWVYQKSANENLPDLGMKKQAVVEEVQESEKVQTADVPTPFIEEEKTVSAVVEPAVVPAPVVEPEPVNVAVEVETVPVTPAEPVQVLSDVVPEEIVVTPEPVLPVVADPEMKTVEAETPFLSDEVVEKKPTKPLLDVLVNKPAYNVSQNEKMFVADPEYETDTPVVNDAQVIEEVAETCADGAAPNADGCCSGEELTDMSDGSVACCAIGTDECFPPMF